MQSDDHLRAHFAGLSLEQFVARRNLLRRQARQLLREERWAKIRRRIARFLLPFAGLLTYGYFSRRMSLFLDRLIMEAERSEQALSAKQKISKAVQKAVQEGSTGGEPVPSLGRTSK